MSEKYGVTLGEENTIQVSGNRILGRISERGTPRSWKKWSFKIIGIHQTLLNPGMHYVQVM